MVNEKESGIIAKRGQPRSSADNRALARTTAL